MKVAIIVDNGFLTLWQYNSLKLASNLVDIKLILNCKNTITKRNYIKYFVYYVINFLFIRNKHSAKISINNKFSTSKFFDFESHYFDNRQHLPKETLEIIKNEKIELIIKFGMNLLNVDNIDKVVKNGAISFHHGDPSKYRGRPAGFYEILNKENCIGIVVQRLKNSIDNGKIIAFAQSKVFPYSYKKTILNTFSNSKYLLKKALLNILDNKIYNLQYSKKLYSLPNNYLSVFFLFLIFKNCFERIIYGLFFEKNWNVSIKKINFKEILMNDFKELKVKKKAYFHQKYKFYADPFFLDKDTIIVEAFDKKTNKGALVSLKSSNLEYLKDIVNDSKKHFSYPFTYTFNNEEFILPEVGSWSNQFLIKNSNNEIVFLKGLQDYSLIDPTYFLYDNIHYIFAGLKNESLDKLYIFYSSDSFLGHYKEHKQNPVNINPMNSRMGGKMVSQSI